MSRRVRRLAPAWAVASCILAARSSAQDAGWVRVVEETDAGLVLELAAPVPVRSEDGWRVPGFDAGGAPGLPVTFERGTWFAVPGPHGARLEIVDRESRDLGVLDWPRQPAFVHRAERDDQGTTGRDARRAVAPRAHAAPVPAEFVRLGTPSRLRGADIVPITFHPVQVASDGRVTAFPSARVRIVFADRARRADAVTPAALDPMHEPLLNAASVARWGLEPRPARAPARAVQALPAQRLRIRIAQRGLYQITHADLRAASVPGLDGIDPRTFKLYFDRWTHEPLVVDSLGTWRADYEPREAAIWVPGEADGSFSATDPQDRIVFWALGPEGYGIDADPTADPLAHYTHPYDRAQTGWLVWGDAFGRRMGTVSGAPVAGDSIVTAVQHKQHFEQDTEFEPTDDLWAWQEIRDTRAVRVPFPLDLGGGTSLTGRLRLSLGYGDNTGVGRHDVDVTLNGAALGRASFDRFTAGIRPKRFSWDPVVLRSVNNELLLTVPAQAGTARVTFLLDFDVVYDRPLVATGGTLDWADPPAAVLAGPGPLPSGAPGDVPWVHPGQLGSTLAYEFRGVGDTAPVVIDVGDPDTPQIVNGIAAAGTGVWRLRSTATAGHRGHYVAVPALPTFPARVPQRDLVVRTIAPLRTNRTTAPDLLVVTAATLRPAAERLAEHRRAHYPGGGTPDIAVVDVQDIYDNFSGGRVDPLAVRNYARFLYELDAVPRLRFVLLFGDGHRDVRLLRGASGPNLVPPVIGGYYGLQRAGPAASYAVDDWFGELDTPPPSSDPFPVPDLAPGRITARTLAEANRMVDKIVAYETAAPYTPWRTKVVLNADDECHPINGCFEAIHIGNTEDLARLVPPELDVVKFYLTEYPGVLGQKPSARAAFIRLWNEGCAVINYQGHGAARQLADEVVFLSTDVPSLTNGTKLPLFLPISCTVGEFDDPDRQSMCEDLLAHTGGGVIASIAATTPTFIHSNYAYNVAVFTELWPLSGGRRLPSTRIPFGLAGQRAKIRTTNSNIESYNLIGDPALTLPSPRYMARFTAGLDTLRTGHRSRVEGEIVDEAGAPFPAFAGDAVVEVFGTADDSGYRSVRTPTLFIPYDLPGPPLYRGTVPVQAGRFSFQFITPVGARAGTKGKATVYAANPPVDATGASHNVPLLSVPPAEPSTGAPRISLRFPSDRTRVRSGTVLTAELRDENGIGIQGTSQLNSIYLDFDDSNEPVDVTAQFQYAAGSDSVGSLDVPLPADLAPGPHKATLAARDNLQNGASASIDFVLVEEGVIRLVNVIAFPNPFRDSTHFFFEVTDPADVEVRVFTTSGRQIWQQRARFETGTRASIKWDGVDGKQDAVANGTYLYRVTARPDRAGAAALEHVGKVVIMR